MAKKAASGSVNVSAEIRKYLEQHPAEGPTAVAEGLKKVGITTTPFYVSTIKNQMKKKAGLTGKRGGGASGDISATILLKFKDLVTEVGGIDRARKALDALSQLMK